jgi:hypothetical protein
MQSPEFLKWRIDGDLRRSRAQRSLALGDVSGESYGIQDGATDTYLHILSEDLPGVPRAATDVVLNAISSHIVCSMAYPN